VTLRAVILRAVPRAVTTERARLAVLCVFLFALYTTYAWVRHAHYLTTGFDLGIFDQVTRDYAGLRAPIVTLKGPGYNLLGDHFHPLIALWAPLYWVWPDPRMLLAAQAALVAASVVPVVRFARRRLVPAAALTVGAVYGLSWPLQRMIQFDVHEIAFAVPLIAVAIDQLDLVRRAESADGFSVRRYRWLVVACVALLGVREDMGAFVVLVAVLVVLRRPLPWRPGGRQRAVLGAGLAMTGVAGYELATAVVIPHFSGGAGFVYWTFPALGPDPAGAVRFALTQPWSVARLMVTPWVKAHTLLALGLPTLYLGLGSRYLLLAAPFLAQRMLNERELLWTTNFHYSSVLAPILVTAAVDTLSRLPWGWLTRAWLTRAWLVWCVGVVAFNLITVSGDYSLSKMLTARFWARDVRVQSITEALPKIPDGGCVEADNTIAPQLTGRATVFRVGRSDEQASWLVLDVTRDDTGWQGTSAAVAYEQALARGFTVVWARDAVVLMSRPGPLCR
jgi:uncharacterized membrane protein